MSFNVCIDLDNSVSSEVTQFTFESFTFIWLIIYFCNFVILHNLYLQGFIIRNKASQPLHLYASEYVWGYDVSYGLVAISFSWALWCLTSLCSISCSDLSIWISSGLASSVFYFCRRSFRLSWEGVFLIKGGGKRGGEEGGGGGGGGGGKWTRSGWQILYDRFISRTPFSQAIWNFAFSTFFQNLANCQKLLETTSMLSILYCFLGRHFNYTKLKQKLLETT